MDEQVLVYDGGYKHSSTGLLGAWGVFVFTDTQLEIYKTMQGKMKKSAGVTGLVMSLTQGSFEFEDKTPDLVFAYDQFTEMSRYSKFLQDPGIKFHTQDDENLVYINTKRIWIN